MTTRLPEKIQPVIALTGMKRLIGLPVIQNGKQVGVVVRGVLSRNGRHLHGLVVRDGLRTSRWIDAQHIELLGRVSVLSRARPARMPKEADYRLFRVTDADGLRIGVVTDALLNEETLCVTALEISSGPVDDLLDGRFFATSFDVKSLNNTGHVIIPCKES